MTEQDAGSGNPYKVYLVTWAWLLVITLGMLAVEAFHLPRVFLVLFLTAFMMVKAGMIMGNFMHMRYENKNLWITVALSLMVTSLVLFAYLVPESRSVLSLSSGTN